MQIPASTESLWVKPDCVTGDLGVFFCFPVLKWEGDGVCVHTNAVIFKMEEIG